MFYITFQEAGIIVHTSEGDFTYPYSSSNGIGNMVWNNAKVVINTKDHRYVRLYHGKNVYDIDYPSQTSVEEGEEAPRLQLGLYAGWPGPANKSLWIDKVILTDDETI